MRLETIKMAGFKSFVDPTVLQLPTNLSGVVGPNGCGKSNIIDAVRWVMGESAASRLRGDSLLDVIFAGSSARKPVGQATVELIFDNSDGTITGEYAGFSQISVKRSVSRDGNSHYYLNGSRCRRRDITDLFLGTGLGPRSYSIIEQGVISEIVEAHPDQLRAHLEEAAGISKYKERRKETESRIARTRDNISRLSDILDEVDKQIERLARQAKAAERWQQLKQELQRRQAELQAIEYRGIRAQLAGHEAQRTETQLGIDRELAEQRRLEAQLETRRSARQGAAEAFEQVQARSFRIGADIARIEQQIRHNAEMRTQLEQAAEEAARSHGELERQLQEDRERAAQMEAELERDAPRAESLRAAEQERQEALDACEARLADWQQRWDAHGERSAAAARAAEVERTRLDYLERQQRGVHERLQQLRDERAAADLGALETALRDLVARHDAARSALEAHAQTLAAARDRHAALLASQRELEERLADARQQLSTDRGRLASLEALQHAALGHDQEALQDWLRANGFDPERRVGHALTVEPGWEAAVETVLQGLLEGVLVADADAQGERLAGAGPHELALVSAGETGPAGTDTGLAARVRGPAAARALLAQVHCADDVAAARAMLSRLGAGHSVITRDGLWLAPGLARIARGSDRKAGVLAREREIKTLQAGVTRLTAEVADLERQLAEQRAAREEAGRAQDAAQERAHALHREGAELGGELNSSRGRLDAARSRMERVTAELARLEGQQGEAGSEEKALRGRLETATEGMHAAEAERRALQEERRTLLEAREEARLEARGAGEQRQRHALDMQSRRSTLESLQAAVERAGRQLEHLATRRADIRARLDEGDSPVQALEQEREASLGERLQVDKDLVAARRALEQHDEAMRGDEQQRMEAERKVSDLRETLAEQRLAEQALQLRGEQLAGLIAEAGQDAAALLAELDADAAASDWAQRVAALEQRITRMEPVNLAAIQEHGEQMERKQYLDGQLEDLNEALGTLEAAIQKIDRETRSRFKETFARVNEGLQALFPRLFGGGSAYLELTGEDLLSAGVAIMVHPPGKRISNISLLSGGEKAVTAVALVFAIFQLNPAPFCILDEVDAPMDEANVGRFNAMVREMSEKVQFIIVTHNKNTMEATDQLCGVTMREPGVSRLVAVDVGEAARLAGAA